MTRGGSISGIVTSTGGQPIADAMIFVKEEGSGVGVPLLENNRTDNKGDYLIKHIKAGVYTVVFFLDEYSPGTATGVRVFGGRTTDHVDCQLKS